MASISLDLSGGSGSVECQANFNFQVSLVYFPIIHEGFLTSMVTDGTTRIQFAIRMVNLSMNKSINRIVCSVPYAH